MVESLRGGRVSRWSTGSARFMFTSLSKSRVVHFSTTPGVIGRQDLGGERGFWAQFRGAVFVPFCVRVGNWGLNLTGSMG